MKVIKKVTMFVAVEENDIKEWATDDVMPVNDIEREEWLEDNAETLLSYDLDGMFSENARQYGVSWKIDNPTVDDMKTSEYKSVE